MQESYGKYMSRVPPKIVDPTSESGSSSFASRKEAFAPKTEGLSKTAKVAIGFAVGATAGYLLGTWAINPRYELFECIRITSALTIGSINAARNAFISADENSRDLSAFLKWGATPAILTFCITRLTIESIVVGTAFGMAGVINTRIKEKKKS